MFGKVSILQDRSPLLGTHEFSIVVGRKALMTLVIVPAPNYWNRVRLY